MSNVHDRMFINKATIDNLKITDNDVDFYNKFVRGNWGDSMTKVELQLIVNNKSELDTLVIRGNFVFKKIIIKNPYVIAYAQDNTKYVAKANKEEFDAEKGYLICLMKAFNDGKKLYGVNRTQLYSIINHKFFKVNGDNFNKIVNSKGWI